MNFSLPKKAAGLAKAGRLLMVAAAAIGAPLIFGTGVAHALTHGFDIRNNAKNDWVYCGGPPANANFSGLEAGPNVGTAFSPGQSVHFEIFRFAGRDNHVALRFCGGWGDDMRVANIELIAQNILTTGTVSPIPFYSCDNFCSPIGRFQGNQITISG